MVSNSLKAIEPMWQTDSLLTLTKDL